MKNRLEYKYLVPLSSLDRLRDDLLHYLKPDEYASARPGYEYTVRSIYLDSQDYRSYYEKLDGVHTRRKFRIRSYNRCEDHARVFFEIKRKHENFISKNRAGICYAQIGRVMDNPRELSFFREDEQVYFEHFYYYYALEQLEPKVLVVYDREAFECRFGSQLRITLDKQLRSRVVSNYLQLFADGGLMPIHQRQFVLEIKFYQVLPQWIKSILGKYDLTRCAVSKYTLAIEAQHDVARRMNKFTGDFRHHWSASL